MKTLFALAALVAATPALAQMPEHSGHGPVCVKAAIAPGFEKWGDAGGKVLAIGQPAALALAPAAAVNFSPVLTRAPEPGTFGGVFPLTIKKAGTYAIALGGKAWIDVIRDGKKHQSVAHNHGPMCSGITKIVDFQLEPGDHQIQLSELKDPTIKAMVIAR